MNSKYFSDDNESSDTNSEISDTASNKSTAGNATEAEQTLTGSELNKPELKKIQ